MSDILLFDLGGVEVFGLNVLETKEIIRPDKYSQLPHAHSHISGCVNVRGETVPVLDLGRMLFNRSYADDQSMVILMDLGAGLYGLKVAQVRGIIKGLLQDSQVDHIARGYTDGVFKHSDGSLVQLLNVTRLLAKANIKAVAA